jgi:hypothetical protein
MTHSLGRGGTLGKKAHGHRDRSCHPPPRRSIHQTR